MRRPLAEDEVGPVIAHSTRMRQVEERLKELAARSDPLLISGKPGTGKLYAAKVIHQRRGNPEAPFVAVDCARLADDQARRALFGAAFPAAAPIPGAPGPPAGGAWADALGGTLVLRHVGALDLVTQKMLLAYLQTLNPDPEPAAQRRLIATTNAGLENLVQAGTFLPDLAKLLGQNTVEMPRLAERKEDIVPLAHLFLAESARQTRKYEQRLSPSAEQAIRALPFRNRNFDELREAIDFAALMADGLEIGAEHIFTGPQSRDDRMEYDLAQISLARWLVNGKVISALRMIAVAGFTAIIILCLTAGHSVAALIANNLVWGLWWPVLMLSLLFIGRAWCLFCPISAAGRIVQKFWHFNHPPPAWIKKQTGWLMALLFLVIIWSESVFRMTERPAATGIFLLTLMFLACMLAVLYQREVWCRYVCPLGALAAGYAVSSPAQVHSNQKICSTQCKTHECFKGAPDKSPCTMFHHPLYLRDAHFCKLCLNCLRICPHQSPRLYLRPPLQDIWRLDDLSETLRPVAMVIFFSSLVMLAAHRTAGELPVGVFTALIVLGLGLAVGFNRLLPRLLSQERNPTLASRISFALIVLAWDPLMAFHLANIPELGSLEIHAASGSLLGHYFSSMKWSVLGLLQYGVLLGAASLALIACWRTRAHAARQELKLNPWGWVSLLAACTIYLMTAIYLTHIERAF